MKQIKHDFENGDRVRGLDSDGTEREGDVQGIGRELLALAAGGHVTICSAQRVDDAIPQRIEVTLLMTSDEAREIVDKIRGAMDASRAWLAELYEREGWKALGYRSWRECVTVEFGQSQAYLYRQLAAAQTEQLISPSGEVGQIPEAHLRPLSALPPEQRAEKWQEAVATAPGGKLTGAHVAAVVRGVPDQGDKAKAEKKIEPLAPPMPMALLVKMRRFLGDIPGVNGAATMPPSRPWSLESRIVNLMNCSDLGYWIEVALATIDEASALEKSIQIVLWLPALVDQDWFRRLAGNPTCFVAATFWEKSFSPKFKHPPTLVLLTSGQVAQERERFAEELQEVGYVWS